MFFSSRTYEILKWVCLIVLPAFSTTLFTLGEIWGWDNMLPVVGSIGALNTLLGACLGFSTVSYNSNPAKFDGTIDPFAANAQTSEEAFHLTTNDLEMAAKDEVLLKVISHPIEH